jgi:hypothetical protein
MNPNATSPNVKIPQALFYDVVNILESIDLALYERAFMERVETVLFELQKKSASINLRHAYSKIVCAKDDDTRMLARMDYLGRKRDILEGRF